MSFGVMSGFEMIELDASHWTQNMTKRRMGCMPQAMTQKAIDIEEIIKTDHLFQVEKVIGFDDLFNIHDLLGHQQQRFKGWLHRSIRLIQQVSSQALISKGETGNES